MVFRIATLMLLSLAALVVASTTLAQKTTPPAGESLSPTPGGVLSPTREPQHTSTPAPTPTPAVLGAEGEQGFDTNGLRIEDISTDRNLALQLVNDGPAVETLIELQEGAYFDGQNVIPGESGSLVQLLTQDLTGEFANIPAGKYVLWVWWGPGFKDLPSAPSNDGLFLSNVEVSESGLVRGSAPSTIQVKPNRSGVTVYPIRSSDAGRSVPQGRVDVGALLAQNGAPPIQLPSSGASPSGQGEGAWSLAGVVVVVAAAAAGVLALTARTIRR